MQKPLTWRELLEKIVADPQERQRIANELGVTSLTILRWANGTSTPREHSLHRLVNLLPAYRTLLIELITVEFPSFSHATADEVLTETSDEISPTFYSRILNAHATTPDAQRFWSISNLILQQALGQLDPNQVGMAITIVQCMPPSADGKVHSLRERLGHGTPPWNANMEQQTIFLGAESLAGSTVAECRPIVIQKRQEQEGLYAVHWINKEESAAAYPIMRSGYVAGSLLFSCAQPDYFLPFRCKLMQSYAQLIALAFESNEFYPPGDIDLRVMPFYRRQEAYFSSFRQRVSTLMIESVKQKQPLSIMEAEQRAWKQLEEELSQLPTHEHDQEHEE